MFKLFSELCVTEFSELMKPFSFLDGVDGDISESFKVAELLKAFNCDVAIFSDESDSELLFSLLSAVDVCGFKLVELSMFDSLFEDIDDEFFDFWKFDELCIVEGDFDSFSSSLLLPVVGIPGDAMGTPASS